MTHSAIRFGARLRLTVLLITLLALTLVACDSAERKSKQDEKKGAQQEQATAAIEMNLPEGKKVTRSEDAKPRPTMAQPQQMALAARAIEDAPEPLAQEAPGTEEYKNPGVNPWTKAAEDKLSTFAVDVDTASYTITRRKIIEGRLPSPDAVRVEEFVNYFPYAYGAPSATDNVPFSVHVEAAPSPFEGGHHIMRVGVQGRHISQGERKPANLTFLVDVSGSMNNPDKLGLAKRALHLVVDQLSHGDTMSLVTYASGSRIVIAPTGMDRRGELHAAIEQLHAGGGTSMGSGMALAYQQAHAAMKPGSVNRVIVISDGDANIGNTSQDAMLESIEGYVKEGITMTTIGVGMGNYKDHRMEQLANKGNGNYFYLDSYNQARRVFHKQLGSTLQVIAKDVKIQVEFDPKVVKQYRLVGYENRDIADLDFRDDKVDAGEIGAGHAVTAIYEVELTEEGASAALGTVRIRHKAPDGDVASENAYPITPDLVQAEFAATSADFRTALSAAALAEKLRFSPHARTWNLKQVEAIAHEATNNDNDRKALVNMIRKVRQLRRAQASR